MKLDKLYTIAISVFIVGTVLFAVFVPFRQIRLSAIDSSTSSALKDVSIETKAYYTKNRKLPEDIKSLEYTNAYNSNLAKDKSGLDKIIYKKIDSKTYQLCGQFKTNTQNDKDTGDIQIQSSDLGNSGNSSSSNSLDDYYSPDIYPYPSAIVNFDKHDKGEYCFDKENTSSSIYDYNDVMPLNTTKSSPSTTTNSTTSTQIVGRDTERSADVRALASKAEEYYATNGEYPTNCSALTSLSGLTASAKKAPKSTLINSCSTVKPSATSDIYQYTVLQAGQSFTLSYWSEVEKTVKDISSSN